VTSVLKPWRHGGPRERPLVAALGRAKRRVVMCDPRVRAARQTCYNPFRDVKRVKTISPSRYSRRSFLETLSRSGLVLGAGRLLAPFFPATEGRPGRGPLAERLRRYAQRRGDQSDDSGERRRGACGERVAQVGSARFAFQILRFFHSEGPPSRNFKERKLRYQASWERGRLARERRRYTLRRRALLSMAARKSLLIRVW
jgi:hypothetical protein